MSKDVVLPRGDDEVEVNVEFDATPIIPASYWQPAEGGEIEIIAVFDGATAIEPPLTDEEEAWLHQHLAENLSDGDFDYGPDDY